MNKLALITGIYKRHELTDYVLNYYRGLIDTLEDTIEIQMFIAGSEGDISKGLVEKYGFKYIETPNFPLTLKFDTATQLAKNWGPDGLVFIGSDDIISKSIFELYNELIDNKTEVFGFTDIFFFKGKSLYYWGGYTNHRKGETSGAGRFINKSVMEKLSWSIWGGVKANNGLDSILTNKLKTNNIKVIGRKMKQGVELIMDVKSNFNICSLNHFQLRNESTSKLLPFININKIKELIKIVNK